MSSLLQQHAMILSTKWFQVESIFTVLLWMVLKNCKELELNKQFLVIGSWELLLSNSIKARWVSSGLKPQAWHDVICLKWNCFKWVEEVAKKRRKSGNNTSCPPLFCIPLTASSVPTTLSLCFAAVPVSPPSCLNHLWQSKHTILFMFMNIFFALFGELHRQTDCVKEVSRCHWCVLMSVFDVDVASAASGVSGKALGWCWDGQTHYQTVQSNRVSGLPWWRLWRQPGNSEYVVYLLICTRWHHDIDFVNQMRF